MENAALSVMDKNKTALIRPGKVENQDSLTAWAQMYFQVHVVGAPVKTQQAKRRDLHDVLRHRPPLARFSRESN